MSASAGGTTCPFCFGEIEPGLVMLCPACSTPHHAACLQVEGGCAVGGCGARLQSEHPKTPAPPRSASTWVESVDHREMAQQSPPGSPPGSAIPQLPPQPLASTHSSQPSAGGPTRVWLWVGLAAGALLCIGLAYLVGVASSPEATAPPSDSVTAPETQPAEAVPSTPAPGATEMEPGAEATDGSANDSASIEVPDGIGMNYQDAQDLWRSSGLVVMPATDATGANRIPIIDSGWVVLDQDPAPGALVKDGSEITATVKKLTDD